MYIDLEIGLELLLEIELGIGLIMNLEIGLGLLEEINLEVLLLVLPHKIIFFMNIFLSRRSSYPLPPPTLKPIPIPPSRPNDFKHIAIMFNLILMFMIFLILLLVAVVMTTVTYRSVVNKQKRDWRAHGRAGETYEQFCSRYYTRYV